MNNAAVEKKLNLNIVILRSIACFGVVCLHSFGWFNSHVDHQLSYSIWYLFSFAIPVFFATSGYFVLMNIPVSESILSGDQETDWQLCMIQEISLM